MIEIAKVMLYTVADIERSLGINSRVQSRYRNKGMLPFRKISTHIYYTIGDIQNFLENTRMCCKICTNRDKENSIQDSNIDNNNKSKEEMLSDNRSLSQKEDSIGQINDEKPQALINKGGNTPFLNDNAEKNIASMQSQIDIKKDTNIKIPMNIMHNGRRDNNISSSNLNKEIKVSKNTPIQEKYIDVRLGGKTEKAKVVEYGVIQGKNGARTK